MSYPSLLAATAALFVPLAWLSALAALPVARVLQPDRAKSPRTTLLVGLALAPAMVALLTTAAVVVPDLLGGCHCPDHGAHHSHLCAAHPTHAAPFVGPALVLLAAWLVVIFPRLWTFLGDLRTTSRLARAARKLPRRTIGGVEVRVADWDIGSAFTVGALAPVIVIDGELVRTLGDEQLRAIVWHEQAHVARRDGLTLAALRLWQVLFPAPGAATALSRWIAGCELECDQHAADKLGDSTSVAEALIAVERLRADAAQRPRVALPHAALGIHAAAGQLESRVLALLDTKPVAARPQRLANDLAAVAIIAVGVTTVAMAWPGDAVHHAVEHGLETVFVGGSE
ncbi:MAG: M56 family metallopeptidase [Deltaproteobacteria bacterium]|nr:M56 family metallopeptidase [Deltaproteobacteria bacterium]MBW2532718.1 M56 family metallopeptidase [Deltaproteobacteria bacterium]